MTATSISVIMPAYNAAKLLPLSLTPLVAMLRRGELAEVIVVDDTSSDDTAAVAAQIGARVMPSGGRLGPGAARNVAARHAVGDILWFVDADVVAHDTGPARIRAALADPGVVAVFGSYDDQPPAMNFGSQYKNLVHHHYHHRARTEASTFWAGCGAVTKQAFLAIGGFDVERYRVPSIEDIELGYRLRAADGRIRFDKDLQGTHLKMWTVYDLVRTDIFRRALPWARLMLSRSGVIDDLNVAWTERLRAVLAGLAIAAVVGALAGIVPPWLALVGLLAPVAANLELFSLFVRRRGPIFAIGGILFHQLYYCYSTATFVWCWAEAALHRKRAS